jgi:Uma2 family endonuclease
MVTYEQWLTMPEVQDEIEEVANGEIILSPPPKKTHAIVVNSLGNLLQRQVDSTQVLVLTAQFGLIIRKDPLGSRVPDLAIFRKSRIVEHGGFIHSAPELIAEVLSPSNSRAEREGKLRDYESLGIPQVVVDAAAVWPD